MPAAARRGDLMAAMVFFAAVNLVLVAVNGVRLGGDSPLYLDGAARLLDGRPLIDRQPSYAGYVAVVAAAHAIGIGTFGVVMIQVFLGAVTAAVVYLIGATLAGRAAGVAGAMLYGLDVDTNRWHQFILADSIYVSLFVLAVWLMHRAATRDGVEPIISALIVTLASAMVRPEGWFLLPAAVAYVIVARPYPWKVKLAMGGSATAAVVALLAVLSANYQGNMQAVGPANMLQRGQTIWDFDGWRVAMPASDASATDQAGGALSYALRHPSSTATLMLARIAVHFAHVRPFYSTPHNVVIVLWLVPLYAAALLGLWRLGAVAMPLWVVAAIASQTLVVALTHAEWDGRYLAHVLPLIDALAAAGAVSAMVNSGFHSAPEHG